MVIQKNGLKDTKMIEQIVENKDGRKKAKKKIKNMEQQMDRMGGWMDKG